MSLAILALLLVSALWGTTFVAVKTGLRDASPLLFVGVRFTIAAIASLPLLRVRGPALRAAARAGLPLGVVLALGYSSQTLGLEVTSPSRSAFITGLNVALVPLWAVVLLRKRARPLSILGLLITLPGLWLFTSPEGGSWNVGDSWTVACAACFALHVILINKYGAALDRGGLLVSQLVVTAVLCLIAAPVLEEVRFVPSGRLAMALGLTAVLATVGTTWLQLRFQTRVDPTRAALIYVTEPLFATGFAWIFIGETLPPAAWTGGVLILAGMTLSEVGSGGQGEPVGSPVPNP
jgi:drug/metabolite transporter (DMT)-like permease